EPRRPAAHAARPAGPGADRPAGRSTGAVARAHRTGAAVATPLTTPISSVAPEEEAVAAPPRRTPPRVLRLVGSRRPEPGSSTDTTDGRRAFTGARAVASALLLVTALVALFAGYLVIGAGLAADRAQNVMYEQLRQDLAEATVPVSGAISPGTPLGVV